MKAKSKHQRFVNRFWSRVDKSGGDDDCWEWTKSKTPTGYGKAHMGGKQQYAHRLAWKLTHGDPGELHVCHSCDNPSCVNPKHLWLGTHLDNVRDRDRKGRNNGGKARNPEVVLRGEKHPTAKLTRKEIVQIRALYAMGGITYIELAEQFGVSKSHIGRITTLKAWCHIGNENQKQAVA